MNVLISKQPYTLFYILIIVILSIMMAIYTFPEALDIGRYYQKAQNYAKIYSLSDYFNSQINTTFDFIYTCSLFIFAKLGLPLNILTVFYLSLYYICICEIIRKKEPVRINGLSLLMILLFVPFIWIQNISRNAAAISFFYLAILFFITHKKVPGIIFCFVSIFTHISMICWILLAVIAALCSKKHIRKKIINICFICALAISLFAPYLLTELIMLIANSSDTRYMAYGNLGMASPLLATNIGYGDKLPMIFDTFFCIIIVLFSKKQDFFFWMLTFLTIGLGLAMMSSGMLTNRIIMLLPLFVGSVMCSILRSHNEKINTTIYVLSMVGFACNFLHFYAYRMDLFS